MPSTLHEHRTQTLEALAILAGFAVRVPCPLPDRAVPDVARMSPKRRALFIGEAKASESPGDTEARVRLMAYLRWAVAAKAAGASCVLAMCVNQADRHKWRRTVLDLAAETLLQAPLVEEIRLGAEAVVLCSWRAQPDGWRSR